MIPSKSAAELLHRTAGQHGELEFDAEVLPGMVITWDPAVPGSCVGFRSRIPGAETAQLRVALLGTTASVGDPVPEMTRPTIEADRWLRLAAVTTLDRQLQLSLNPALLAAEIAAAQFGAAGTLPPDGVVSEQLTGAALDLARRASDGVVRYVERLGLAGRRFPPALEAALARLVDCYGGLAKKVDEPDDELAAVVEAWQRMSLTEGALPVAPQRRPVRGPAPRPRVGVDVVDPRQVPARLLEIGSAVGAGEIAVTPTWVDGRSAVRVRIAAFRGGPAGRAVVDLRVRLVARRSGRTLAEGLLNGPVTTPSRSFGVACERYYEAVVVLPDAVTARDVRVDVSDSARSPAPLVEVRRARRAALFLAEWRALVADARIGVATPATRIHEITRRLTSGSGQGPADAPLWGGGPSLAALQRLADLDDRALAVLLATGDGVGTSVDDSIAAIAAMVRGPGELLAAELAAAHRRSAA
jgi:hypothetical protein